MSHSSESRRHGGAGRVILWIVTLLLIAAGSYASYLGFRANPYLSDIERHGVSKFRFIYDCRQELGEQLASQLPAGSRLTYAPPVQRVESVVAAPAGGWQWQSVVLVRTPEGGAIPAQFACAYDKAEGETRILGIQPAQ